MTSLTPSSTRPVPVQPGSIHYAIVPLPAGPVLVAFSPRGLCALFPGTRDEDMEQELRQRTPPACTLTRLTDIPDLYRDIARLVDTPDRIPDLPLDLGGTAFQKAVWAALRTIPPGETRTYGEIAVLAGRPGAARAVGQACGANPVAVVIPCHRVVAAGGRPGGYRWGLERKKQLLERERRANPAP